MIAAAAASASTVPAWLPVVLVGLNAVSAIVTVIGSLIGDLVQLRRLEALDRQRTELENARHQQVLAAINTKTEETSP